jgi:soluble lytic murein transglycosylase-like protein
MRHCCLTVALLATTAVGAAAERSAGVVIFTAPDGTRRILSIPVAQTTAEAKVPAAPEVRRASLWNTVQETSNRHGLDPKLVDLVIRMESGYHPYVVSPKGAQGVMQLMPETASLYGVHNAFDPIENISAGVRYLKDLLARYNSDVKLALAAYNAGPGAVDRHGGVPPYQETRKYVNAILNAYSGVQPPVVLTGGFGRPATPPARPVSLVALAGKPVVSNVTRLGEAPVERRLVLH